MALGRALLSCIASYAYLGGVTHLQAAGGFSLLVQLMSLMDAAVRAYASAAMQNATAFVELVDLAALSQQENLLKRESCPRSNLGRLSARGCAFAVTAPAAWFEPAYVIRCRGGAEGIPLIVLDERRSLRWAAAAAKPATRAVARRMARSWHTRSMDSSRCNLHNRSTGCREGRRRTKTSKVWPRTTRRSQNGSS